MRALLQRVTSASVEVEGRTTAEIALGWLIFIGVGQGDDEATADTLAEKVALLRCFQDEHGKTNLAAADVSAEMLVVSQFTLYADTSRGRRPSFTGAAPPDLARTLVDRFCSALSQKSFRVATGEFGADMKVSLINDGPFTIWLDSAQ